MALETRKKLIVTALAALMLVGCGGAEDRKAKYLERGKAYIAEENWAKAKVEIKNVLQIDPKSAEAYFLYAKVEEKQREWAKSFADYKKAVELDPGMIDARARLAQIYVLQANAMKSQGNRDAEANALGEAQKEIDEILKRDATHNDARALQASMLSLEGKDDEAMALAESVIKEDPGNDVAVGLLAALYDKAGRTDDAEKLLVAAAGIAKDPVVFKLQLVQLYVNKKDNVAAEKNLRDLVVLKPDELSFRVKLAQFLVFVNENEKAEAVMREMVEADPEDAKRYIILADLLINKKDVATGIEYLQGAIKQKPELFDIRLGLAQVFERKNRIDDANAVYEAMIEHFGDEPAGLAARNRLARNVANTGDVAKAKTLLDQVLVKNPKDGQALLAKGRLAFLDKDYDVAVNAFRAVLKDQPDSVEVLHLLAETQLAKGDIELAGDNLRRAVELVPQNADAHIKYARYLMVKKDLVNALEQLDIVLAKDPENYAALATRSEVMAAKGDLAATKAELMKLKEAAPDNPEASLRLARLHMAEGDAAVAMAEVDAVLARDEKNMAALILKTDILAATNDAPALEAAINRIKAVSPDSPEGSFRLARYFRAKRDFASALGEYENAYKLATGDAKLAMLSELIEVQIAAGQVDQALTRVNGILRDEPDNKAVYDLLGIVQMARKDYVAAEAAFIKQTQINPNNAMGYAQLSVARERQGNTAGAVAAYELGLGALKDDISLQIGLAGLYERQSNFDAAMGIYEKVLTKQADNLIAVNNLAALLVDHRTDAQSLARAKELVGKLAPVQRPDIQDTVGWVYYRTGDYAKAVEILEGVVNAAPKAAIFHYHLGMAYAKTGAKAKAKTALNKALELGNFLGSDDARETLRGL